jgi:CotH kinase protein/Secretion system C-terminal sorting domain
MHKIIVVIVNFLILSISCTAQLSLFEQDTVNEIRLIIPVDSFAKLYALDGKYHCAKLLYSNGFVADTVDSVAIRFRGNTSLVSIKKSIKISFNNYHDSIRYKGVRKLNLIGNHNDPTMIREKLFNVCWQKFGLPKRRVSFVKVYVNDIYFGLYTNVEEIDKEYLQDHYSNDNGNLYKCSYGSDLTYINNTQAAYKNLYSGSSRTYDLQTNETADNYSDLVQLIATINSTSTTNYLTYLDTIFDYKSYLKILALDIATGNWDDYAYNKSNYMLYHDSASKQFKFITIDTDNTFGVDWSGIDWTTRNPYLWYNQTENRPLVKRLLSNVQAKQLFTTYLDSVFTYITHPDTLFPIIDKYKSFISAAAAIDSFRTLDYGYTLADFNNGFSATVDNHTPYGIKPFLQRRRQAYVSLGITNINESGISIFPNPFNEYIVVRQTADLNKNIEFILSDITGKVLMIKKSINNPEQINLSALNKGVYFAILMDDNKNRAIYKIIKQ